MFEGLVVEQLTKYYGPTKAVEDVSFTVQPGTIVGLLGPNGAGKTTTMAMLLHLVQPTQGTIVINGVDVWQQPHLALRSVGSLIEQPAFYPYLSAFDNLRVWSDQRGSHQKLAASLEFVGLDPHSKQQLDHFSQGMKQRLGIAQALLGQPQLLILDEPTVGIDPRGVVELRAMFHALAEAGKTVILSSHQLAEVQHVCDHVVILNHGRCVAQGAVQDLLGVDGRILIRVLGDQSTQAQALTLIRAWHATKARLWEDMIDVLAPPDAAAPLNRLLVEAGFEVAELQATTPSLEDFFLQLTAEE